MCGTCVFRYNLLVDEHSEVVFKTANGFERQMTFVEFTWRILRQLHGLGSNTLNEKLMRMVGDVWA